MEPSVDQERASARGSASQPTDVRVPSLTNRVYGKTDHKAAYRTTYTVLVQRNHLYRTEGIKGASEIRAQIYGRNLAGTLYWATRAASMGTDAFALRDAGGWSSLVMPSRYVDESAIANEGVKL